MEEPYKLVYQRHAVERMSQRSISEEDIEHVVSTGVTIETYADDTPYPSRLLLGWIGVRPLHVVIATDIEGRRKMIITAYEPDPSQWETNFRRRK